MSHEQPNDVTQLLNAARAGDQSAAGMLIPMLHEELRKYAGSLMRQERAGHTLQPTALVNEAWLKLEKNSSVEFGDRSHFLRVAARAMRQVLVENARRHNAAKRVMPSQGSEMRNEEIEADGLDILALDSALDGLRDANERLAEVVDLKFFAGMSHSECAEALGLSERTIERDWEAARAWLRVALEG